MSRNILFNDLSLIKVDDSADTTNKITSSTDFKDEVGHRKSLSRIKGILTNAKRQSKRLTLGDIPEFGSTLMSSSKAVSQLKISKFDEENRSINLIRKDNFGNTIKKGGDHKISFIDNISHHNLAEIIYIKREEQEHKARSKSKREYFKNIEQYQTCQCSSVCNIF